MAELTSEVFKFFSVRLPKSEYPEQIWELSYRDQKVYFGPNTPPVIASVEDCVIIDIAGRNEAIDNAIISGKNKNQILSIEELKTQYKTASDDVLNWLQTNASTCTIGELKAFILLEIGVKDQDFIDAYYQVSDKFKLWDTLYAETISPNVENNFFKERLESTIVISEIMERYKTLTDTSILLHTILDRVTFTFPDYLMKQILAEEAINLEADTKTEKLELLAKLKIALSEINARIRAEKIKNKNLQILNEIAAEIYAPENAGTAQN